MKSKELAKRLEAWAQGYRNGPVEYRFPSDPAGEFFPPDLDASAALLRQQAEQIERLREALAWYGEQARLCRIIHKEGDAGRHALDADGGKRARVAMEASHG